MKLIICLIAYFMRHSYKTHVSPYDTSIVIQTLLQHLKNSNLENFWSPKVSVQNVIDFKKKKVLKELTFNPRGEAFVVEKRKISGHFSEKLELMEFPFDHQASRLLQTNHSHFFSHQFHSLALKTNSLIHLLLFITCTFNTFMQYF